MAAVAAAGGHLGWEVVPLIESMQQSTMSAPAAAAASCVATAVPEHRAAGGEGRWIGQQATS